MQNKISHLIGACCVVLALGSAASAADMQLQRIAADSVQIPSDAVSTKALSPTNIYIVQLQGDPIVAYEGDIAGYAATKPGKGKKVNRNNKNVKKYGTYLKAQQDQLIHSAGGTKAYNYTYALNGFAARMTAAEAAALKNRDGVVNVWKDEIHYPQTNASPNYIGITEAGESWSKGYVGEDVVLGIIDTGVWPEHPSFADVATPKKGNKGPLTPYSAPSGFTASGCDFGNTAANPADAPFACNNKLVAARCYNLGQSSAFDPSNPCGGDGIAQGGAGFQSARDDNGHGSHTASTAGGNNGVPASIGGEFQGVVSGVAPRAHIAAYKVCWFGGGCASSDSAAAIDDAVADGVDVINFSIGGASNFFNGPDDISFLFAAANGVWVATSNGNAGPGAGTVGTPSGVPWITAVGATQDSGVFYNSVTVNAPGSIAGDYVAVEGASPVQLSDTGPITDAVTHSSTLTACNAEGPVDSISGIALVSRGICSFSEKYNNVAAAGALAIIVYNDAANPSRIDPIVMSAPGTTIPGVMVGNSDGLTLAGETGVNATLDAANAVPALNRIAGFSSRGPNNGANDIIKPDVSAPGVAILAAGAGTDTFISISGTSMASPHVAGTFALLKQAHPDWSAAEARSAVMTTARNGLLKTFGTAQADPFDVGAGEILPSAAFDPGLAYDADIFDYVRFTCGADVQPQIFTTGTCDFFGSIDSSDLNLPSIGIGDLVGAQTITRTVTSVANNNGWKTYNVSVDAPPGIDVSVSPSTVSLKKGMSASYDVTFTVTGAANLDEWAFGSLSWDRPAEYSVRSPIAVRPTAFSTADEVDGVADGSGDGSVNVPVAFGYDGDYSASVSGILGGFSTPVTNITGPQGNLDIWCVDLPAMTHFRLSSFDEDTSDPGADDIDLRLFLAATDCATFDIGRIGASGGATSEEVIDIADAPAGGYVAVVDYFSASNGTDTDYKLWFQPVFGDDGNTTVTAPANATLGNSDTVTVDYTGLAPTRNLGVLHHMDGSGEIARTILDIDAR